jgi:hypothetical protein
MGGSIFGGLLTIIAIIALPIVGWLESGNLLGAGIVFVIALIACIIALIGFIPFGIGPGIYIFAIWPWLTNTVTSLQPTIHTPLALFGVFVITIAITIIYTIVSSVIVMVFVKS